MYTELNKKLEALLSEADLLVTNLSNASALLNEYLPDINWVGFYILNENRLLLGPFQGKTACVAIPVGKGVCGTAAQKGETVLVDNVHEFPGHIACDCASSSEIVVPIFSNEKLVAVLDIDSPSLSRFTEADKSGLGRTAEIIGALWDKCLRSWI